MSQEDFEKAFSEQVNKISLPEKETRSLGLGRKIQNAYSRHKKAILLTTLITGLSFGILNMTEDGIRHYRIGMERAAESIIVKRAEQTIVESERQVSHLENTIAELTSSNQTLIDRINHAQYIDSRRATELTTLRREYDNSNQRITNFEQQISLLESDNTHNDSALSEKQKEIDLLTTRLSTYETLIVGLDNQLSSREIRITSLEEQIRTYSSQSLSNNDLQRQIQQLNQQIEQNQTQIRTYERQLSEYQSQISARNNTINNLENQVRTLSSASNNNSELQRQLQQVSQQVSNHEQQITSYESQVRLQETEIRTRDTRINNLEDQLRSSRTESESTSQLNSQIQQLNQQVNNYERQIAEYQRHITERNNTISSLEQQLQSTRSTTTISNDLQNQVQRLTQEVTQYQSQLNNYERQMTEKNNQISSLNRSINSLNNQISSLRTNSPTQSTTNISQTNDTYDSSAINLLSRLSNTNSDRELILQLDNYDAVLYYSHNQRRITLDIIDKGCRTSCTSQVRITSSQNNIYSLEWGSFNHPQGGYSLGKDAFDRALAMIR